MIRLDRPLKDRLREPAPLPAALDATWARIRRRRGGPEARSVAWLALVPALVLLGVFGARQLQRWREPAPSTFALADGHGVGVLESAAASRAVAFTDGSQITLAPDTQLRPHVVGTGLFRSELTRGRALFDVVPHGPRRWVVQAGEVQVSVLGTRFSVELRAGIVDVEVERGLVEVAGPSVPGGRVQLRANQRLQVPASAPPPTAASDDLPASGTPPSAAQEPSAPEPSAPEPEPAIAQPVQPKPGSHGEDELVRLLARADKARLDGAPRVAAEAFELVVRRYPSDPRAALAAFTLGRLYLDQLGRPERAVRSFERARALGLPSVLAEEAEARLVEALVRAGQLGRARAAAAAYVARFPGGVHRAKVETWTRPE